MHMNIIPRGTFPKHHIKMAHIIVSTAQTIPIFCSIFSFGRCSVSICYGYYCPSFLQGRYSYSDLLYCSATSSMEMLSNRISLKSSCKVVSKNS